MNTSYDNDTFNIDMQKVILACLIADHGIFKKCKPHTSQYLFDDQLRRGVRFILSHEAEYQTLPSSALIHAKTGIEIKTLADLNIDHLGEQWFSRGI